jgi:hypothetical protein
MTESFEGNAQAPRRGRRDPALADALGLNDQPDEVQQPDEEAPFLLEEGSPISAKTSISIDINGKECWFTYKAGTTIIPGETEEDANARLEWTVNTRVIELADNMETRLAERAAARRDKPIRPR